MRDGILVLNKPQNWTSSDCVAICRRNLKLKGKKKIGHAGTLDPMAEGVLPIFVGQSTRIMEYLDLDYKTYRCEAKLGLVTDTQDIWGEVLEEFDASNVDEKAIREAISSFSGIIEQYPPMYSAVRIEGRRLYDYARNGETEDVLDKVKPRKAHIRTMDIIDVDAEAKTFTFQVECSKGTYIRTICNDIGTKLGCGCVMTALTRVAVGNIGLEGSISPEYVKTAEAEDLEARFIPIDYPLVHFGVIEMKPDRVKYFVQGNGIRWHQIKVIKTPDIPLDIDGNMPLNCRGRAYDTIYKVYSQKTGVLLGTGFYDSKARELKADKILVSQDYNESI